MIMRSWTGRVRTADRDSYARYVLDTGLGDYRRTPGNLGAWLLLRDLGDETTEVTTLSQWESEDAIRAFAGDDLTTARFYPDDDQYLIARDLHAIHYDIVG